MQAALNDLSTRRDSPSFATCQRVLLKCHEIIFSDLSSTKAGPYSGLNILSGLRRRKIKHHAEPAFIGLGAILAGAPGLPQLTKYMGEIAIDQGRAEDGTNSRDVSGARSEDEFAPAQSSGNASPTDSVADLEEERITPSSSDDFAVPHYNDFSVVKSELLNRRQTITGAQTVPALPLHLRPLRKSRAYTDDPLGQLDVDTQTISYQSSPSIPSATFSARTPLRSHMNPADVLLEQYDKDSRSLLLRNHFCLSEVSRGHH